MSFMYIVLIWFCTLSKKNFHYLTGLFIRTGKNHNIYLSKPESHWLILFNYAIITYWSGLASSWLWLSFLCFNFKNLFCFGWQFHLYWQNWVLVAPRRDIHLVYREGTDKGRGANYEYFHCCLCNYMQLLTGAVEDHEECCKESFSDCFMVILLSIFSIKK